MDLGNLENQSHHLLRTLSYVLIKMSMWKIKVGKSKKQKNNQSQTQWILCQTSIKISGYIAYTSGVCPNIENDWSKAIAHYSYTFMTSLLMMNDTNKPKLKTQPRNNYLQLRRVILTPTSRNHCTLDNLLPDFAYAISTYCTTFEQVQNRQLHHTTFIQSCVGATEVLPVENAYKFYAQILDDLCWRQHSSLYTYV